MKDARKQQKRKAAYLGDATRRTYQGTKTQPNYAGLPAGRKLGMKATRGKLGGCHIGVVAKAYEMMSRNKRAA